MYTYINFSCIWSTFLHISPSLSTKGNSNKKKRSQSKAYLYLALEDYNEFGTSVILAGNRFDEHLIGKLNVICYLCIRTLHLENCSMNIFMNILWLLLGGIFTFVEYLIASVLMMITIIGIPFGIQTLKMATLALYPFGKKVQSCPEAGGCLNLLMNILWIFLGGIWISLSHLAFGIVLCITIIGIPFGIQHFKLAGLALTPFGKEIVNQWKMQVFH